MAPRYALVTAGAQGLGRAIVQALARQHHTVFIHYHTSQQSAQALQTDIAEAGGQAYLLPADLTQPEARERLLQQVAEVTGKLHVLVNNVGWYPETPLSEITLEQWELALNLNCTTAFHLIQLARPLLEAAAPASRIVNLGDAACDRLGARVTATPYHIAKIGLHVLTRSYARILTPKGITVNMISPGFLENSDGAPPARIPAGRTGQFSDILGALTYLLSEEASYVSGANLTVSGAWNLG